MSLDPLKRQILWSRLIASARSLLLAVVIPAAGRMRETSLRRGVTLLPAVPIWVV